MEEKDYIRFVRKRLRLSQDAFGKVFGKSRAIIANYETGRVAPPDDFVKTVRVLDKKTKRHKTLTDLISITQQVASL